MEDAVAIDAAIRVRAEEVALRLRQVRRQPRAAIGIVVGERGAEARHRNAEADGGLHDEAPAALDVGPADRRPERVVEQQVDEVRVALERLADVAEQRGADDAAGAPDLGDLARIDVVVVLGRRHPQERHALRVRRDLAGVERVARRVDELLRDRP